MANRIDNLLGALKAALDALESAGTVAVVQYGLLNPLTAVNLPAIGLVLSHADNVRGGTANSCWEASVLLQVCTRSTKAAASETVSELMAEIEGAINALATDGTAGGVVIMNRWDFWYHNKVSPQLPVGAMAGLILRPVKGTLKIGE